MVGHKPIPSVKNLNSRRREAWKKSYKLSDPSSEESVYAGPIERNEACAWMHHQAFALHAGPDTIALAFALFDRAIFTMKVKKCHVSVLASSALLLAAKMMEDDLCKDTGKFLMKQANLTFSKRDLIRMEKLLLQKFDWRLDDATAVDMVYTLANAVQKPLSAARLHFLSFFLASQLVDFELSKLPCLEVAVGALMTFHMKSGLGVLKHLKPIPNMKCNLNIVNQVVTILTPKLKKLGISQKMFDADEEEMLPYLYKLFSRGCIETPFGTTPMTPRVARFCG